uniref:Exonuclease domain-containing protein n=1 Tax=viral metagenome TaxID=1070528 RepID=A0A6C0LX63_9ZZZZ
MKKNQKKEMITRSVCRKFKNFTRVIFFDLETTGFNIYHNSIIEIGAIDNLKKTFSTLIKVDKPLKPKIVEITGITDELLLTGEESKIALLKFRDYVESIPCKDIYLLAHNCNGFDKPFLETEFKKYNIRFNKKIHFVDTLRMAQLVLPFLNYHSMKSLSSYFNIINPNAHRAFEDATTLQQIYQVLETFFYQKYGFSDISDVNRILNNPYKIRSTI